MARTRKLREGVTGEEPKGTQLDEAGRVLSTKNLDLVKQLRTMADQLISAQEPAAQVEEVFAELDDGDELEEHIRKDGSKFYLYSKKGKKLGEFDSEEEAQKREGQIRAFKNMKESASWESIEGMIRQALREKYPPLRGPSVGVEEADSGPSAVLYATYPDHCVFGMGAKQWQLEYKLDENDRIVLGSEPIEVVTSIEYTPVRETVQVIEAVKGDKTGREFDVMIIEVGLSKNNTYYSAETLKRAVPLFEGADSFADHITEDEQKSRPERSVRDKVGKFTNPMFGTFNMGGKMREGIKARFRVVAPWLRETLKEAMEMDEQDFLGFSIEGEGKVAPRNVGGKQVAFVEEIQKIRSVDVVTTPAAGGRIMQLVASDRGEGGTMDPEELAKLIQTQVSATVDAAFQALAAKAAELEESDDSDDDDENEEEDNEESESSDEEPNALVSALQAKADDAIAKIASIEEALRVASGKARLAEALASASISEPSKADLREKYEDLLSRRDFDDKELASAIDRAQDYEAKVLNALGGQQRLAEGSVPGLIAGLNSRINSMQMTKDYYDLAIGGMFDSRDQEAPDGKKVKAFRSIREAYCAWTGESPFEVNPFAIMRAFGAQYDSALDHHRIRETVGTTDWGEIFADNLYIKMQKDYVAEMAYNDWRMFCSETEDVPDFQSRHWSRVGGYGDLSTVAEKGTYPDLTDPTDEEVVYAISKRGGLDDVTFEAIVGDRFNAVRKIPTGMARSASRTLYKFVMNMMTTDNAAVDYDATTLYHANHSNTNAVSLTLANVASQIRAMRDLTAYNESLEILGERNYPKFMIVPNELEQRARRILDPSDTYHIAPTADTDTSIDPQAFKGKGIVLKVYDVLTDADDWFLVADPNKVNTMVMGFLNGQQEPEMFIQNDPTTGSVFTADKITYKVRHIYGGDILEHRSFMRATQ